MTLEELHETFKELHDTFKELDDSLKELDETFKELEEFATTRERHWMDIQNGHFDKLFERFKSCFLFGDGQKNQQHIEGTFKTQTLSRNGKLFQEMSNSLKMHFTIFI